MKTYQVIFDCGEFVDNYICFKKSAKNEKDIDSYCRSAMISNYSDGLIEIPELKTFVRRASIQATTYHEMKED